MLPVDQYHGLFQQPILKIDLAVPLCPELDRPQNKGRELELHSSLLRPKSSYLAYHERITFEFFSQSGCY